MDEATANKHRFSIGDHPSHLCLPGSPWVLLMSTARAAGAATDELAPVGAGPVTFTSGSTPTGPAHQLQRLAWAPEVHDEW